MGRLKHSLRLSAQHSLEAISGYDVQPGVYYEDVFQLSGAWANPTMLWRFTGLSAGESADAMEFGFRSFQRWVWARYQTGFI
jgi:hypothetical protein